MRSASHLSERYLPFDPELPEKDQLLAAEVSEDVDRRMRADSDALAAQRAEVAERASGRVRELFGADSWLQLRRTMRAEGLRFSDALQPPDGLTADFDRLNSERRLAVQHVLDGLGVRSEDLRAIYRSAAAELAPVATDDVVPGHAAWLSAAPPAPVMQAAGTDDPHAWHHFRAPFAGHQIGFGPGNNTGAFRTGHRPFVNSATGLVGYDMTVDNNSASDVDQGGGTADTQIVFLFRAPVTGRVEIQIDARSDECLHQLRTVDEFGWSSSDTEQRNFLMAHVVHPNVAGPSFGLMSRFIWRTDVDSFVQRRFLQIGGLFGARLFSNGQVPGGTLLEVRAGTRGIDGTITNDVSIHGFTSFRWTVQNVFVRIAP